MKTINEFLGDEDVMTILHNTKALDITISKGYYNEYEYTI